MNTSLDATAHLTFLGAAGTVTGSRYLLEAAGRRVLVDCGLFQGYKTLRMRNWEPLPVSARHIDAVVLTHAHLDHSGYLPRLVRDGFHGRVWSTPATRALCEVLLPDAGHLQEEDAAFANRHGFSRHRPAEPLYTRADAVASLERFETVPFGQTFEPAPGLQVRLAPQGHILGAASARFELGGTSITFSGDIGRPHDPIMRPPQPLLACDWLVTESTYGDREHVADNLEDALGTVIRRVAAHGGVVVIPAFAVARAQALLHHIARLRQRDAIPHLPVYLDSPMAIDVTGLYKHFRREHRLSDEECHAMCGGATFVRTVEDSKRLSAGRGPMVIVSASGMATGGRVLHHLKAFAPDHRNAIVLAGYQVPGTRGASLAAGARGVRIHGVDVPVRAEVVQLEGASAHADASEIMGWLRTAPRAPRGVFVTHGEAGAADALRQRIEHELGWQARVPMFRDRVDLRSGAWS
jgi:metallo-beta-lactamase family protein